MYYIILLIYYSFGILFFIISDIIISYKTHELTTSELLEELL